MTLELREYQHKSLDDIREHFSQGIKKVLLWLPTGAGKTLIFCNILKALHAKGKRAIMVVRGTALVDQASHRLDREQVPHGVFQGNHWRRLPSERIQVCSIDTLYRRKLTPPADLVVIDEAHLAASESYMWLVAQYPEAFFLPVTATPYVRKGLRHIADAVVHPVTIKEIIEQGFLVPARYYIPTVPDLSNITIDAKTHDYNQRQLFDRMNSSNLFGDLIKSYREHGENRPAICFAVSIEHSLAIVDAFRAAGIPAAHLEADTPMAERNAAIKKLEIGSLKVISNVGILTTGVDIPCVSCIIMARPTKSYNLYIQSLGRGTRIYPGKKDFIVLDHAANVQQHGFIEEEKACDLDGRELRDKESLVVRCSRCFHAWNPILQYRDNNPGSTRLGYDYICRGYFNGELCLYDNTPIRKDKTDDEVRRSANVDASFELQEVTSLDKFGETQLISYLMIKIKVAIHRGYKPGWVFHQVKEKFGEKDAKRFWRFIQETVVSHQA